MAEAPPVEAPAVEPPVTPPADDIEHGPSEAPPNKATWPEDWRQQLAGEDKKKLDRLGRFDSPGKIFDSYLEMEGKYSANPPASPFPAEGTDEEKGAWREAQGLPKEPAGYLEKLPEGLVIGEGDRENMDMLASELHAQNATPGQVHAAMGVYYKALEKAQADMAENDIADKAETEDALNKEWGPEYRRNINDLGKWLDAGGDDMKAMVLSARLPDGTKLGNNPDYVKWMVGQMREVNPVQSLPGLGAGDPAMNVETEIAAIEKVIKDDNRAYVGDAKMQDRYLQLLEARNRLQGKT